MFKLTDKTANIRTNIEYLFAKTAAMFEWDGLPESLPAIELERMLQHGGFAFVAEVDGEIYAFTGGLGGQVDVYNRPTEIIVANPALSLFRTMSLERDGVLIRNDSSLLGLKPIFERYSALLEENTISLNIASIQTRMRNILGATDDRSKASAERYLEQVEAGSLAVIAESALFEGVKNHGSPAQHGSLTSLIEYNQYIKAQLFEEIGVNVGHNMKRERLNEAEVALTEDALFPFVDNMMSERLKAADALNERFGLNVRVDYGSIWHDKDAKRVDDIVEPVEPVEPFGDVESFDDVEAIEAIEENEVNEAIEAIEAIEETERSEDDET